MSILVWIIFGAIAGWLAHLITGRGGGLIVNIIVGIGGAFIGGFVMSLFGGSGVTGFNLPSLLVAILGAVVLLVVVGLIKR
jgi:uncharacterized membrane protein YeaQ/YmgE (transglycosylase-associated protein family)